MASRRSKSKTFKGRLELLHGGLGWVIVRLPFDVEAAWGARGMLKVHVEVNDCPYRTSLFPTRKGEHFLLVNKKIQKAAGIRLGSEAKFAITPDIEPREIRMPPELEGALSQDRRLRKWFDRLNYSTRKWLSDSVADAKSAATRRQRAQRVAEQVMETMEAEIELPPMIRTVFRRHPGAEQAWRRMTEKQRRGELLAIFYYRTPLSRIRRIEKVIYQTLGKSDELGGAKRG
jgi:uncharacterized protein YdeI (YjbR/CyaY-like superfamily)